MGIPNSRAEAILQAKINGEEYKGLPQSRIEELLIELNTGGGGGGTTNYNALTNRPTINGNVIEGEIDNDILELVEPLTEQDVEDIESLIEDD